MYAQLTSRSTWLASLMRIQHTSHSFPAFPVYSCTFITDDQVLVGAGGGASRTGIKNKLRLFRVSDDRILHILGELELGKDEDAPMSMAAHPEDRTFVCGVNSSAEKLENGKNENCRKFSVSADEHKFTQLATCSTLVSGNQDDYQRVTTLSLNGKYLAVAGAHDLSLLYYHTLLPVAPSVVSGAEIYDVTFSSTHLFLTTSSEIRIYTLPGMDGERHDRTANDITQATSINSRLNLVKTIVIPLIPGVPARSNVTFRAARLCPSRGDTFYSVVNVVLPRVRHAKVAKKRAYILRWRVVEKDGSIDASMEIIRKVCDGNLTCFDASLDGRLLALGASDYSLRVLHSNTLTPLLSVSKAHEFPITTLRFNPTSKLLVSGSVDNSIRVVSIPEYVEGQSWSTIIMLVIAILAVMIAVLMYK